MKLFEVIQASIKRLQKFFLKFVAPYVVYIFLVYGLITLFRIKLNEDFWVMIGSVLLWLAYIAIVIVLAFRIKGQADMQKTQQKLKSLSGRKVATEIEAFVQEVLPIVFDVFVKLGFAVGMLYLHLTNEERKWAVYSDSLITILLIVVGALLMLIYFSIAFYVSKIDVEVVKNFSKEKSTKKSAVQNIKNDAKAEVTVAEQVKPLATGYDPYFDPKIEGSINYGLTPDSPGWEDYATSPFNPHPTNPNYNPNPIISKHRQEFIARYRNGELKGLSKELFEPKETNQAEPENESNKAPSIVIPQEISEKKIGEQPNPEDFRINTELLEKIKLKRETG